jgi:superfamily I DNA/RNA helicase
MSALDFDDLVAGAVRLLAKHGEILSLYRKRFRFIFVDEYQDVNFGQYALIRLLAPNAGSGQQSGGPELCVIGDPHQAIYGFRGADKCYIDRFLADYPGAAAYRLTKSFRCAGPIITAAGRLVDTQLEGRDTQVSLYRSGFPTEKAEAEGIARRISRLIGGTTFFAFDSGVVRGSDTGGVEEGALKSLGECAILLRAAALSPPIEKALRDHGIPFHLIGEKPWREEESIYVDAVNILTIHASKGLEFDHVFVAGIEEGLLPFTLYDEKNGGSESARRIDEERRLLYVAMTRARSGLYLSWARSRIFQGRKLERGPSRFLGELENLIPRFQDTIPKREKDLQLRLF